VTDFHAFQNQKTLTLEDEEYNTVTEGRIRIRIAVVAFAFMLLIAIVRLAEISVFSGGAHKSNLPQALKISRADLTDRNGELLATTLETYSLYAEPRRVWNPQETTAALGRLRPHLDRAALLEKLELDRSFVWLERGLTPKERQAVFDLGLPGLAFRKEPKRVYPRENLASHIIGFTNVDMQGVAGSERAFDAELTSDNAPSVALSLDIRVQYALTDELAKAREKFDALDANGVVMDIRTGEIIAMASVPNFNPNDPDTTSPETLFNHAAMSPSDVPLNIKGVLGESSNRGTAMIAQRIGGDQQQLHLRNLGLLSRVEYELG